ncbi:MAG: hypothetical protein ACRYFU_17015 [Janthinobacterium lividum]
MLQPRFAIGRDKPVRALVALLVSPSTIVCYGKGKFARASFVLLFAFVSLAAAQSPVATIRIRVLSGRDGKPVKRADSSTTVLPAGTFADAITTTTDRTGLETVYVPTASSLRVLVKHHASCDALPRKQRKLGSGPAAAAAIVATGVVSGNRCGKQAAAPTPGELTLYVRPWHWWQRFGY